MIGDWLGELFLFILRFYIPLEFVDKAWSSDLTERKPAFTATRSVIWQ